MKLRDDFKKGASIDAVLLTIIKLMTTALGFIITRLLSEYLSVNDYGTYSQVLLIVSTVSSVTILGMIDGINFFFCNEKNEDRREEYIATIFSMQCIIGAFVGLAVMLLTVPICNYFENPDLKSLMLFAALLPLMQNVLAMMQVLIVSIGKARMLAIRNLFVSLIRLSAVFFLINILHDVVVIFIASFIIDVLQIMFFMLILNKNGCKIKIFRVNKSLILKIFEYCVPMAIFIAVNSLNRDIDKYLISYFTDTETLAVYAVASKPLPFDILMASFCTVLLPQITRLVSDKKNKDATLLYRKFLEISYISTGILCFAAISVAPQLIQLFYTDKYANGITVFCIYILVDLFRFTNTTLVLCAAKKTLWLMFSGVGMLIVNSILNVLFFNLFGISGPAFATLLVTVLSGVIILSLSAKALESKFRMFFDFKYLILFFSENIILTYVARQIRIWFSQRDVHYFIIILVICAGYSTLLILMNCKRLFRIFKEINTFKGKKSDSYD